MNVEVRDIEISRDEDAVRRCLQGDRPAFEELAGPHLAMARGLALRLLGNLEDAQDAVQEALFKAWRGLPGWRPTVPFGAWLMRIVFNQCVDARRRRGTRARHEAQAAVAAPQRAADRSAQRETLRRVAEAFARLPPRQAAALHLRVLEELDYAAIGAMLGLSGASARIYVVRARITLRRLLARELGFMSHPRPSLLHRYVLGEADGDERLIVERHAASCATCRAALAAEHKLDELLVEAAAPADSGLDRAAFESLWARADAAPPVLVRPAPLWRAAAAAAVLLAAGALAWWGTHGPGDAPVLQPTADVLPPSPVVAPPPAVEAPPVVEAPQAIAAPPQAIAASPQVISEPPPPLDPVEVARLAAVREDLRRVLASAQQLAPDARADLVSACEPTLASRRSEGWPTERLVAGLVADADPDAAQAALRLAAGTRDGQADVAACLRDERRTDAALAALEAAPDRPPASATLADALLALLQPAPDGGLGANELRAAKLLASDAGPAARESLGRALDRALATVGLVSASDIARVEAAHSRLFALAATAPADVVAQRVVTVVASADMAGALLARAATRDAEACGAGLRRAVETPRLDTARRLASLATRHDVATAMPALLVALDAHPDEPELLAAVSQLARAEDVPALAALLRAERGRTRDRLEEALLAALRRDPELLEPMGTALAADEDEAVRFARALGSAAPGPGDAALAGPRLLLAALAARPAGRGGLEGTSTLLSALATCGASESGPQLLAWIGSRPDDDPCLPLAWTAAARLAPEPALSRWTRDVGDPQLLARAADGGHAWPEAAPSPPRRLLEPLRAALLDVSRDRHHAPAGSSGPKELR